jgi:hypothetical protein
MKLFQKIIKKPKKDIVLVSGLPRSGTSMMMKMLEAGGIPPLTDEIRSADIDNPKGYYEFERVKKLPDGDSSWLKDAEGRAVKIISALLKHLPSSYSYKVIFMRRKMSEILASQKAMLARRGEDPESVNDEEMAALFGKHLQSVIHWLETSENIQVLYVDYNVMLKNPENYKNEIEHFIGSKVDSEKMMEVIDSSLYRQRQT